MRNHVLLWFSILPIIWIMLYHFTDLNNDNSNLFIRIIKNGEFGYSFLFAIIGAYFSSTITTQIKSKVAWIIVILWLSSLFLPWEKISIYSPILSLILQLTLIYLTSFFGGAYILSSSWIKEKIVTQKINQIALSIILGATLLCVLNSTYFHDKHSATLAPTFGLVVLVLNSFYIKNT